MKGIKNHAALFEQIRKHTEEIENIRQQLQQSIQDILEQNSVPISPFGTLFLCDILVKLTCEIIDNLIEISILNLHFVPPATKPSLIQTLLVRISLTPLNVPIVESMSIGYFFTSFFYAMVEILL